MAVLHIFNGDCACDCWKKKPCGDAYIVWRENYLEGPLPAPGTQLEEFEQIRADFLHRCCAPEIPAEELKHSLLNLDNTVLQLTADDTAVLWFDMCMFDQLMLSRILFLLQNTEAEIRLLCEDAALGDRPDIMSQDWHGFRILSSETIKLYASAWIAVSNGAEAVQKFNESDIASAEPILRKAMLRYAEDHPTDGSLPRSMKQVISMLNHSAGLSFRELFLSLDKFEEHLFMGDTTFRNMLAEMIQRKFSEYENGKYHLKK